MKTRSLLKRLSVPAMILLLMGGILSAESGGATVTSAGCHAKFTGPYPAGATQYYNAKNNCNRGLYCQVIVNGQVHQKCVPRGQSRRIYVAKTKTSDKIKFKAVIGSGCP